MGPNMASLSQNAIRTFFGAAEHVAPALAGRIAFALFARTQNPNALGDGARKAVERTAGFMAEARRHCLTTRFGRVTAFEFRPAAGRPWRGTVLVVHGWASRTEFMKAIIEGLREANYRVVSLDLPGHGHSAGRQLNMVTALEALRVVGEWFGPLAAVVGHSFGGAVAVNAVAGSVKGIPPLTAERLVLIAAPSSMPAVFEGFAKLIDLGPRSYRTFAGRVEKIAGYPLDHYVGSRRLAEAVVPTLVIHAPDDREVPAAEARDHAAAGGHVRLTWVEGLGHRRILADPGVVAKTVAFLSEGRITALAS